MGVLLWGSPLSFQTLRFLSILSHSFLSIKSGMGAPTIREVKTELRHREWAEQIQECQSSGMTVTAWCKEKGISQHTYYSRLNVVRKELLKRAGLPLQQIVPLSVSQSVTCTTATMKTQCIASGAEPEKAEPAFAQKVIVRKDGIEVEMPPDISEEFLLTLLRGLKEC